MGNTPKRIAIIGAGQLGSRHLQGLTKIKQDIHITVIDPNLSALEIARQRFVEMPENPLIQSVAYLDSLVEFVQPVELAIIATNSDVRRNVIEELVSNSRVKYLILEKVVFQSVADFEAVMPLLKENSIKAWVNCSRRMFPFFRELKKRTVNAPQISLTVEGSHWGLGCNTIHMLDLLAFLTEQTKFEFDTSSLDLQVYEDKRKGFIELGGELRANSQRGDILTLVDRRNHEKPFKMLIQFDGVEIEMDQMGGRICEYSSGRREKSVSKAFQPLQSELTNIQAEEILRTGDSQLTKLEESYLLHKPILDAFNHHLSGINNKQISICPIT